MAALETRTEGWVAALQLAALSLQGRDDPARFIAGFAGDDRFVVDYLADEVLDRQPDHLRRFLLETSVLDRMTGPLCDAVTGGRTGGRCWRRWNGRTCSSSPSTTTAAGTATTTCSPTCCAPTCSTSGPETCAGLHRRASAWYDGAGDPEAAVGHALSAGDVDLAADLVERAIPAMLRERREDVDPPVGRPAARRRGARTGPCSPSGSSGG